MEQLGLDTRSVSHRKRAESPQVKMKPQQHWQRDSAMVAGGEGPRKREELGDAWSAVENEEEEQK